MVDTASWWRRCLRLEVSPQQIAVQLRGAGAPRGGFLVPAGLEHTVQDSRSRDCPVGPNVAIGRGERGRAAQAIER